MLSPKKEAGQGGDRALSYTCPAGGGLREVCAAVARGRRLLWGLVHLNGLHWDLLRHCPTYETERLTCTLSHPAANTLKHPHAQGLAHCFPTPIAIFPGSQRSPSCPEFCLQGLYTLFLLSPSPPTQGLASALFGELALTHQRHDLLSSQDRKVAEYLLPPWQ